MGRQNLSNSSEPEYAKVHMRHFFKEDSHPEIAQLHLKLPLIKHVGHPELCLEVCGASQNETRNIGLVGGNEELYRQLCHLAHVVVALLHSQTSKAER